MSHLKVSANAGKASPSGARLMATALAAGAGAVVLIFVLFAQYHDLSQNRIRRGEIEKYLQTITTSAMWGVDNWLSLRVELAESLAAQIAASGKDADPLSLLSNPVYKKTFIWTYFAEPDGAFHIWPPDEELPPTYDPRARPWYQSAIASGAIIVTEPYLDTSTEARKLAHVSSLERTITVTIPVYSDGALRGVVGADFFSESLSDILMESDVDGLGAAFLVSGAGKILAHPNQQFVAKSLSEVYPKSKLRMDGSIEYLDDEATPQIVRFVRIPTEASIDWRLGVAIDKKTAYASLGEFRTSAIFATVAAALLMIVVLGVVIHRLLVAPLLDARRAADCASAAKSEFLASMSHEIRTPMNDVIGMAEVLLNTNLSEHQRQLASIIASSGQALITVINDILDFSKLDAGKLSLSPAPFNLRRMIYEIAIMMQARALEKDVELIVRYAPDLPEGVVADETRLRQVLGNLVGNAVKFTEHGHVLVNVSGERVGAGVNLHFSVTDTGIGIAAADIPRMFERFEQANASHTRRFGGTGLGLAICKNIVALMKGEIGADSELGHGSRFWFTVTAPSDDKIKTISTTDATAFDRVRVLGVDDNAVNRRILEELTAGWGMRASVVANGGEAMAALEKSVAENDPFSVILVDYQMPGEDGVALTGRIQAIPAFAAIPVVMLSSIDAAQIDASAMQARFAAQVPKPVPPSRLMDVLVRILCDAAPGALVDVARKLAADPVKEPPVAGSRLKVLLAEDNVVNQLVVKNMINAEMYDLAIAQNGAEAVDLFLKLSPDIILMDLSMPVVDGLEAARRIRDIESERHLPRTPIIAATAHVFEQDRERCESAGMDDVLTKPVRKAKLDEILARWVGDAGAAAGRRSA